MIEIGDIYGTGYKIIGKTTILGRSSDGEPETMSVLLGCKPADKDTPAEYVVWSYMPQHCPEPLHGRYISDPARAWMRFQERATQHADAWRLLG